ncbi:MAG: Hint domain-containing protein [Rickettsiales bacterium]|nr:Hint domain-containing protein [Rickettsiales bacterium]
MADWNASPIVPPYMLTACCNISCPRGTVADIDPCGRTETVNTGSEGQGADPNAPTQAERVAARMNTNIQKALAEGVMSVANECQSCQDTEGPEEGDPKDVDPIGCEGLSGCEVTPQDAYTICIPTLSCTPISENPCDKVTDLTDPHRDPSLQATTDISCTVAEAFCILEGTEIVLVDGSKKNIEDIKLGDKLRSGAKNVVMVEAVSKVIRKKGALHSINGSRAFITAEHPIMTTKGWKAIAPNSDLDHSIKILGALEVGDEIVTADGTETVKTIEAKDLESDAGVATYNLIVNGDGTFVADGVVVKSMRKSAIYY